MIAVERLSRVYQQAAVPMTAASNESMDISFRRKERELAIKAAGKVLEDNAEAPTEDQTLMYMVLEELIQLEHAAKVWQAWVVCLVMLVVVLGAALLWR